jgi:small conductance mechanosensitive channel
MHFLSALRDSFADDRLLANLGVFCSAALLIASIVLLARHRLARLRKPLPPPETLTWRHRFTDDVHRHTCTCLFWATLLIVGSGLLAGVGYHFAGHDVREDVNAWYGRMTVRELEEVGGVFGFLAVLGLLTEFSVWLVRRLRPHIEDHAHCQVGCEANRESLSIWFTLVERYLVWGVRLASTWGVGVIIGFGEVSTTVFGFLLRILTILVAVRLLTLACRTLSHKAVESGDRHLGNGKFQRYWERLRRLLPFGQRCFESAVYVAATSLAVRELHFIAFVADYGPRIVQCIGILFGTRVLIELSQVLLNETFGLYEGSDPLDAKGRTLAPLLQSVCQYVLYFGSGVVMLGVLGLDTRPILAGAGILGLAVGLGAQSLVTDVVSGFFILFENQFLVGDYVQIGDAVGTVEAVSIRLTQVRDGHGKLFIIPNGQIKGVVNYSKGFVNAVVDVRVPAGSDLEDVFQCMVEAGRRLQAEYPDGVLAETEVHGLVDLGTDVMTVRAVTRVQPGTHGAMQSEYRRMLKLELGSPGRGLMRPQLAA